MTYRVPVRECGDVLVILPADKAKVRGMVILVTGSRCYVLDGVKLRQRSSAAARMLRAAKA
jgi:hypothetical protein